METPSLERQITVKFSAEGIMVCVFLGVGFRKNENKGDHTADILISGALRKLKNNAVPETLTVVTSTKSAASCHFPTH